jgi:hypothetical protein
MLHTMSPIINCCVVWMEAYFSAQGMETRGIESPFAGIIIVRSHKRQGGKGRLVVGVDNTVRTQGVYAKT